MKHTNEQIAQTFYRAFGEKDLEVVAKYLHPEVCLVTPLSKLQGKENYLQAAVGFMDFFDGLTIRAALGEGDQAVIVYDLMCPDPIGTVPAAALMTFKDGLLIKNELFHDTSPWAKLQSDLRA